MKSLCISTLRISLAQALVSAAALAFCASAQAQFNFKGFDIGKTLDTARKMTGDIDEPQEIQIGQNYATVLLGTKPLLADQHVQRYVNALGHYLALQSERPDLPWTFAVLDDPGFNAFATPGGYIFVTRGLLERMHNEAELAGVLGHEIGHVLRKHYLKAVKQEAGASLLGDVADRMGKNSQLTGAAVDFIKQTYAKGLDQEDEFEADRVGVVIATRAGYDPFGLPAVLQILQEQSAQDNNFSLIMKTHPAPAARLDRLDKLMSGRFDNYVGMSGPPLIERIKDF
ncbi:MAG TPA: M48 family metallopeptidase [Burkholderiaceae bacterium]